MTQSIGTLVTLAQDASDAAGAAWSALWLRSAAKWEVARLCEEGRLAGESCDLAFAVSFEPETVSGGVRALTEAGFTVADTSDARRGFVTVTAPIALGTYALARTAARVRRTAQRLGGHAEIIGTLGAAPRPVRERPARESMHTPPPTRALA
jgi:hypothetical protein